MQRAREFDYFHVVEKGESLSAIVARVFNLRNGGDVGRKVQEVAKLNPHVKDANRLRPGMFLRLGLTDNACFHRPVYVNDLEDLERIFAEFPRNVQQAVQGQSDVLNYLSDSLPLGKELFTAGTETVSRGMKSLAAPAVAIVIEETQRFYVRTVQELLVSVRKETLHFASRTRIDIIGERLVKISIDASGLRAYAAKLAKLGLLAKALHFGGVVAGTVDMALDAKEWYDASGTMGENRVVVGLAGKAAGGMAVGAGATYLVCNLLLGFETGGTSLLWCGAFIGGAGTIAGGKVGSKVSTAAYDTTWGRKILDPVIHMFTIPGAW